MADHASRKQEGKRVSSPEQMNEYIRVARPGTWLLLIAVALLLAGFCVWAFCGRLKTCVPAGVVVKGGSLTGYVADDSAEQIRAGETLRVGGKTYTVAAVSGEPQEIDELFPAYLAHLSDFQDGDWVRSFSAEPEAEPAGDGMYRADVVVESVSPVSFLWN